MDLIISIKPKFAKSIIAGIKKYEFRRSIFKKQINKIYIYESSPTKLIIASFQNTGFIYDSIGNLWEKCKNKSGIDEVTYLKYFKGKTHGYAIIINNLKIFSPPIKPERLFKNFKAPQSFIYIE